jgi:hypothetical protein
MIQSNIMLGLTVIGAGCVCIALGLPLMKRKIRMNRWYGVRIPKSFQSEEYWFKINEYGGRQLVVWSVPLIAWGAVVLCNSHENVNRGFEAFAFAAFPVFLFIATVAVRTFRYAGKL